MGTVIQFSKQRARGQPLGEDHVRRSCLPPMLALTPWWPVLVGLQFWSEVLGAIDCGNGEGDVAPTKVIPMAGLKARRVS